MRRASPYEAKKLHKVTKRFVTRTRCKLITKGRKSRRRTKRLKH